MQHQTAGCTTSHYYYAETTTAEPQNYNFWGIEQYNFYVDITGGSFTVDF
jgi:hypothetical protein